MRGGPRREIIISIVIIINISIIIIINSIITGTTIIILISSTTIITETPTIAYPTRMDEMKNGIDVADADGKIVGRSVAAGKLAVFQTVTTRSIFLPIFPLVIPPVVMQGFLATGAVAAGSAAAVALELVTITISMSVGLPCALALLPLQMSLDVKQLEPEFQKLGLTHVYASKGL